MYCRDLKQWSDQLNAPKFEAPKGEHNALVDAKWNKAMYEHLAGLADRPAASQGAHEPRICCESSWREMKDKAWAARNGNCNGNCGCDHSIEYCDICYPLEFREGGKFHSYAEYLAALAASQPPQELEGLVRELIDAGSALRYDEWGEVQFHESHIVSVWDRACAKARAGRTRGEVA